MKRLIAFILIVTLYHSLYSQQIIRGVRVSYSISDAQMDFINTHFQYLITPYLSEEIRNKVNGPVLLLYRSIQGTWENFEQFDWEFIDANENMFCHSDSLIQDSTTRILTIWGSWLMDGNDFVDPADSLAQHHWVNYYAITASGQVIAFSYDGLFIDSAGHKLGESAVEGNMPYDYSDETWRDGRYSALQYIKSQLPDNTVIFNGLHSGNGADSSLSFTDGGMWEDFAYDIHDGHYKGLNRWLAAINCLNNHNVNSKLVLVVKKPGLSSDMQARMFSVASFLLVANENTALSLSDYALLNTLQYYPEYEINLGSAIDSFEMSDDTLFTRAFENGLVIVNPSSVKSKTCFIDKKYYQIIPVDGGVIDSEAIYNGHLTYQAVESDEIEVSPVSAVVLLDSAALGIENSKGINCEMSNIIVSPNPFTNKINLRINFMSVGELVITLHDATGKKVQTLFKGLSQEGVNRFSFTIDDNLPEAGLRFVKVKCSSKVLVKKLLKL